MKKNRRFTRTACLALAAVVMAGSMAAAALGGSPYDTLKDAMWNALNAESGTFSFTAEAYIDGVRYEEPMGEFIQYAPNASLTRGPSGNETYQRGRLSVQSRDLENGVWQAEWRPWEYEGRPLMNQMFGVQVDRGGASMRLAELFLDLLIGDLKNNLAITQSGGVRTVSGTVTAQQVPELYNAALTVMLSQTTGSRYYGYPETVYREYTNMVTDGVFGGMEIISQTDTARRYRVTELIGREKVITEWEQTGYWLYTDPETGEEIEADDPRATPDSRWFCVERTNPVSETRTNAVREDYGSDKMNHPMEKGVIEAVSGTVSVDENGYPIGMEGMARVSLTTVFGDIVELEILISGTCEKMNATEPRSTVKDADEVLTEELFASMTESEGEDVYAEQYRNSVGGYHPIAFTLNPDGTINRSSLSPLGTDEVRYFSPVRESASVGIIGGADGPTQIFINQR